MLLEMNAKSTIHSMMFRIVMIGMVYFADFEKNLKNRGNNANVNTKTKRNNINKKEHTRDVISIKGKMPDLSSRGCSQQFMVILLVICCC